MSAGTARIVRDIIHLIARASARDTIFYEISKFKITVNAVEKDARSVGKLFVYDSDRQPHYCAYIFYGLFEVTEPNSTVDTVDVEIRSKCNRYTLHLNIIATAPLVISEPGIYGIMLVYEYQPPLTAPVVVR